MLCTGQTPKSFLILKRVSLQFKAQILVSLKKKSKLLTRQSKKRKYSTKYYITVCK